MRSFLPGRRLRYTHHGLPSDVASHMQAFLEKGAPFPQFLCSGVFGIHLKRDIESRKESVILDGN